jgi:peptidoglycan/LPS O-acetylase OafA/YrhL
VLNGRGDGDSDRFSDRGVLMGLTRRLNGLDHLRALAISYVFIYHYAVLFKHPAWLGPLADFGWSGVDLFFVLSGFLIGGQLLGRVASGQETSIKDFYVQRFLRIMPAYWVVLAFYFAIPAVIERGQLPPLWRFLTFTQNFGLNNQVHGAFSHAWSLCIEEHFYLVLPCLIFIFSARRWWQGAICFAGLLVVLGGAARAYCLTRVMAGDGNWSELIYYPTYCHLDGLIIGVAVAAISAFYPQQWSWLERRGYVWLFAGLALVYAAYALDEGQNEFASTVFKFPLVAMGFGLIVIASVSRDSFLNRSSAVTKWIAVLSYSIYLIHKIVIHLLQGTAKALHIAPNSTLMFVLCIAGSIAAAYALNIVVERPFMRLRDRLFSRHVAASLPTGRHVIGSEMAQLK